VKLVLGEDARVADWLFEKSHCRPMQFNLSVGIEEKEGELVGGFMFTSYNGSDAEVHFYGPSFLKRQTVRTIFQIALKVFDLNRLTIRTRKEAMSRGVLKLGAVYEGTVRRLYGPTDDDEHAGKQYAFFRDRIEALAATKQRICFADDKGNP
jgi:hypothetical protein